MLVSGQRFSQSVWPVGSHTPLPARLPSAHSQRLATETKEWGRPAFSLRLSIHGSKLGPLAWQDLLLLERRTQLTVAESESCKLDETP